MLKCIQNNTSHKSEYCTSIIWIRTLNIISICVVVMTIFSSKKKTPFTSCTNIGIQRRVVAHIFLKRILLKSVCILYFIRRLTHREMKNQYLYTFSFTFCAHKDYIRISINILYTAPLFLINHLCAAAMMMMMMEEYYFRTIFPLFLYNAVQLIQFFIPHIVLVVRRVCVIICPFCRFFLFIKLLLLFVRAIFSHKHAYHYSRSCICAFIISIWWCRVLCACIPGAPI